MNNYNQSETKWNIDDARMKALEFYMENLEMAFLQWDLNNINKYLRAVFRVVKGTGKETDEKAINEKLTDLEGIKREYEKIIDYDLCNQKKIEFYNVADEIFEMVNKLNKEAGIYFRKGNDPKFAALRR